MDKKKKISHIAIKDNGMMSVNIECQGEPQDLGK